MGCSRWSSAALIEEAGNKLKKLKFFEENGFLIGDPFFLGPWTHGRAWKSSPGILEVLGGLYGTSRGPIFWDSEDLEVGGPKRGPIFCFLGFSC